MKTILSAAVFVASALTGTMASAADLGTPWRPVAPVIEEFGSGWYLRGDIGWTGYRNFNADYLVGGVLTTTAVDPKFDDVFALGGGAGFKAGWLRADITADYRFPARYGSATALGTMTSGEVSTFTALANAYVDLGNWGGITPYVGGGIGAAVHQSKRWFDASGTSVMGNVTKTTFAWALTSGIEMKLTPSLSLDFAYRYVDLGRPESGYDASGGKVRFDDLTAHELRAGVRYLLD